jgi:hypothetical protein
MPLGAVSGGGVVRRNCFPSKYVNLSCYWLLMVRSNAPTIPAKMIQFLALWYRPDNKLIEKPMDKELSPFPTVHTQIGIAIL